MMRDWSDQEINAYYEGIRHSDYPAVFWERMLPLLEGCKVIIDVGCGPGAFTLKALEAGLRVQAVDSSIKNLQALKAKVEVQGISERCHTFHNDWLEAEVDESDVSVAAYSFAGSIGSPEGLRKIADKSRKAVFFIIPYEKKKVEFSSEPLYEKLGIAPPSYGSHWYEVIGEIFIACRSRLKKATLDVLEYDFGIPLHGNGTHECALFLCRKMGLEAVTLMEKHVDRIKAVRNGIWWVPNLRKSVLVSCLFD